MFLVTAPIFEKYLFFDKNNWCLLFGVPRKGHLSIFIKIVRQELGNFSNFANFANFGKIDFFRKNREKYQPNGNEILRPMKKEGKNFVNFGQDFEKRGIAPVDHGRNRSEAGRQYEWEPSRELIQYVL